MQRDSLVRQNALSPYGSASLSELESRIKRVPTTQKIPTVCCGGFVASSLHVDIVLLICPPDHLLRCKSVARCDQEDPSIVNVIDSRRCSGVCTVSPRSLMSPDRRFRRFSGSVHLLEIGHTAPEIAPLAWHSKSTPGRRLRYRPSTYRSADNLRDKSDSTSLSSPQNHRRS
jgi:hypothetical protein